jgi:hypothetical protein
VEGETKKATDFIKWPLTFPMGVSWIVSITRSDDFNRLTIAKIEILDYKRATEVANTIEQKEFISDHPRPYPLHPLLPAHGRLAA